MRTRFQGIGPYNSFRTGPGTPMDPEFCKPVRYCRECGAVLSQYNMTDTCAPCSGSYEIPPVLEMLVGDRTVDELYALACAITGERQTRAEISERTQAIRDAFAGGESLGSIAKRYDCPKSSIQSLCKGVVREAVCHG